MPHRFRPLVVGALALGLVVSSLGGWFVSSAMAGGESHQPVLPRLVATVIALDPRGLATIRTGDGAVRAVVHGGGWRVGDLVTCEQYEGRSLAAWWTLDCRKAS
jgi:hypothetical protein